MPVNETEYLKFNVNEYINSESADPENIEMPANETEYLKFDVNDYINSESVKMLKIWKCLQTSSATSNLM